MEAKIGPFEGFGQRAISFWPELEADNSKAFFAAHRDVYDRDIREPMERLLAHVSDEFGDNSKVFRPHRDVRFSKDKSPYKLHCGAVIGEGPGTEASTSVYYVQVSAAGVFSAAGCYMMSRDQLQRFYAAIDDDDTGAEVQRLVDDATTRDLTVGGSALKTAPRGYSTEHVRIGLLRHKSLTVAREFSGEAGWMFRPEAVDTITQVWREAAPLNAWLEQNVGPAEPRGDH
ncbi:MAG: DUF2461 domain-containing protein [Ornithinimicrobium sp.]